MIAMNHDEQDQSTNWQESFLTMLPEIEQRLRRVFRHLDAASREEAIAEGVVHCLLSFAGLHEQGRATVASASTLAWFASLAVKRGRPAGNRMRGTDPMSRYCQVGKGIQVERLPGNWIEQLVEDKRASVPDQVAAKLDVSAWFATLSQRMQQIAKDLACGHATSEVAEMHNVTAGRISQLRRTLEASWSAFQQEVTPALAS